MTRRRWIADEVGGDRAALTGTNAIHLSRVLRAQPGQQFDLSVGDRVRLGTVVAVGDDRVEFALGEEVASVATAPVTLLLAVFKFDRFEWAVEKCTELGVARIVPVITRRTEAHLAQAAQKRAERWRRIAREAAQQSRRIAPPDISDPTKLKEVLPGEPQLRIVLNENEGGMRITDLLQTESRLGSVELAIGPEGGWTEEELALFAHNGWFSASLGPTILRAETAAIAATAIATAMLS